jgi:predicted AAA+ superfamily ATPase
LFVEICSILQITVQKGAKMAYIPRKSYTDFLNKFKNTHVIKVMSGVRRAGKSTIFKMYRQELRQKDIQAAQI